MARVIISVRHDGASWYVRQGDNGGTVAMAETRREAIAKGAEHCRLLWKNGGIKSQLRVFNRRNGRQSFERTYPRSSDPRRRKG
jgi:hypothetical protein